MIRTFILCYALTFGFFLRFAHGAAENSPASKGGAGSEYDGVRLDAAIYSAEKSLPAKLTVDEAKILRQVSPLLFGYNFNWRWAQVVMVDSNSTEISEEMIKATAGLRFPLNRMSGTESQYFSWKGSIGKAGERTLQGLPNDGFKSKKMCGLVEWIKACQRMDSASQFTWTFNLIEENPEDHADLVEFLTGDGRSNPRGGTNWALRRIELGIEKPVKVACWELGNEIDLDAEYKKKFPDAASYVAYCRETISLCRQVDPNAKFAALAATAPWTYEKKGKGDWKVWHREALKEIGKELSFVTFHPYYLGFPLSYVEGYLDQIRDDIKEITGSDRIKLYISEHAKWPSDLKKRETWTETHALIGCLSTAQFFNRMLLRGDISLAAYHCFSGGPWGMIYKDTNTGLTYPTGMTDLFRMWTPALGENLLASELSGEKTDPKEKENTLTATVQSTGRSLRIFLVNREPDTERSIELGFKEKYRLTRETILSAKSLLDFNTSGSRKIKTASREVDDRSQLVQYRLPPKSAVILFLEPLL